MVTLVTMLTIVIIVVAGLGVLNTVALQIRERAHAIGVFKAVGMIPLQTLVMIICSVAVTGLLAGIMAVPAGVALHHGLVPVMAQRGELRHPAVTAVGVTAVGVHPARPGRPADRGRRRARPGQLGCPRPHRLRTPRRITDRAGQPVPPGTRPRREIRLPPLARGARSELGSRSTARPGSSPRSAPFASRHAQGGHRPSQRLARRAAGSVSAWKFRRPSSDTRAYFARLRTEVWPDSFISTGVDAPSSAAWVSRECRN